MGCDQIQMRCDVIEDKNTQMQKHIHILYATQYIKAEDQIIFYVHLNIDQNLRDQYAVVII